MVHISYINGEYKDYEGSVVSIEDRGYQFSDGVYEVVMVKSGVFIDFEPHCTRLQRSLDGLRIDYDVCSDALLDIANELMKKNELSDAALYMQITRGVAPRKHRFPEHRIEPSVVLTVSPLVSYGDAYDVGSSVVFADDLRWKRRDIKSISLLPNILATQQAMEDGADEAILVEDNVVREGASSNVFMVNDNGQLCTHPVGTEILPGITREAVIRLAKDVGIEVAEETFSPEDLAAASEVFITSTTKKVMPVVNIGKKAVGNSSVGPVTLQLMQAYDAYIESML